MIDSVLSKLFSELSIRHKYTSIFYYFNTVFFQSVFCAKIGFGRTAFFSGRLGPVLPMVHAA